MSRHTLVSYVGRMVLTLAVLGTGCGPKMSTVEIVSYRETGESTRYREMFDEAYYDINESGNVDIVLHRITPGAMAPEDTVVQTVHVRTVWRCVPGHTVAHSTQINGAVTYAIVGGGVGATFEGAGSVFFSQNRANNEISGTLDLVRLKPAKKLNDSSDLFYRTELSATFQARRDSRKVVALAHAINEQFESASTVP